MKLWASPFFRIYCQGIYLSKTFSTLDIWDQVATITNFEKVMRLASHTGSSANPDFALRHYSRCGPNDETVATLSFLGAVHGGGPGGNKISNS